MSLDSDNARLAALPPQTVRPREGIGVDAARRWAEQARQNFALVDLAAARDKAAALRKVGQVLRFPGWYGGNLDALYDCLTDLPDRDDAAAGWLILIDGLASARISEPERSALLDVFRDAAASFARTGLSFRVLYA